MSDQHPHAICEVCQKTFSELLSKRRFKSDYQPSLRALITAAERGCRACAIIHHNFSYTGYEKERLDEGYISVGRLSSQDRLRIFLSSLDNEVVYGTEIPFYLASEEIRTCLSPQVDDGENVGLVKTLIKNCVENHPGCASDRSALPTRLLDVSPSGSTPSVRVVQTYEVQDMCGRYISLSHCWGLVPPDALWKLTKRRRVSYAREIPLDLLPLTFRQAIEYTRKLGERYLWIDSLCIIQDSAEDWAKEASNMATIYSNSICTLSAATASSLDGCMLARESWLTEPLEICLDAREKAFLAPGAPEEGRLQEAVPVTRRAWCLQERELTNRLIQFTPYQWLWSCKTSSTSERILRGLSITAENFTLKGNAGLKFHGADNEQKRVTRADGTLSDEQEVKDYKRLRKVYEGWYKVVETFTRCQITYPSDRLPAIAGMAHRQRDQTTDIYLAGLWQNDICFGLDWACYRPQETRPPDYIAPSWSWACLNSPITFQSFLHHKTHQSPTLISAHIVYAGPDPLGRVKGGHIRLRGRLKAVKTEIVKVELPFGNERNEGTFRRFNSTETPLSTLRVDTKEDAKVCDEVICLPVLEGHGIALKLLDIEGTRARPAYSRVGSFSGVPDEFFEDVGEVDFDLY